MSAKNCYLSSLVFFALLGLSACGDKEGAGGDASQNVSSSKAKVRGVTDTEIVLGSHSDLSGPTAIWGVGSINGIRMRFEEANEADGIHGRKIKFIVEDTGYQIPRAIQAANKLIHRDQVFALVGSLGTQLNNTVLPNVLEAGVPNLFPFTGARSMNEPFHRLKFTQRGVYYDEIRAGVKHAVEAMGKKSLCVIYQDTDYGHENLDAVVDQAAAMNMEVVEKSAHKPTETEFTAAILRLRNAGCDVVFTGTVHRDTVLILETAHKMGWKKVAFIGNDVTYGDVISGQKSGAAEGFTVFVHLAELYEDDDMSAPVSAWWQRYESTYNQKPDTAAMEGYRAADLTVKALEIAGRDLTVDALIAAMESINDYTDIFGNKISFGPDDHKGVSESVMSVIENGRWVTKAQSVSY